MNKGHAARDDDRSALFMVERGYLDKRSVKGAVQQTELTRPSVAGTIPMGFRYPVAR
jgi:hypothetical protein